MTTIGAIRKAIMRQPGDAFTRRKVHVPNTTDYEEFWAQAYTYLMNNITFRSPLSGELITNPYFGNFGLHFHPVQRKAKQFHIGTDFTASEKTPVQPILSGVLEYAGFHYGNGHYVMLSHPKVQTEDGFVLHTLYMHMHNVKVGFSKYQKMLREISLRSYPEILIPHSLEIGSVGASGDDTKGFYSHLHLQCEFRHKDGTIVAVNPGRLLGLGEQVNITANITDEAEFLTLYEKDPQDICDHCIERYWDI